MVVRVRRHHGPVAPQPLELEVGQVEAEPVLQAVQALGLQPPNRVEEIAHSSADGRRHCRLQLAQLHEHRRVKDRLVRRGREPHHLADNCLDDDAFELRHGGEVENLFGPLEHVPFQRPDARQLSLLRRKVVAAPGEVEENVGDVVADDPPCRDWHLLEGWQKAEAERDEGQGARGRLQLFGSKGRDLVLVLAAREAAEDGARAEEAVAVLVGPSSQAGGPAPPGLGKGLHQRPRLLHLVQRPVGHGERLEYSEGSRQQLRDRRPPAHVNLDDGHQILEVVLLVLLEPCAAPGQRAHDEHRRGVALEPVRLGVVHDHSKVVEHPHQARHVEDAAVGELGAEAQHQLEGDEVVIAQGVLQRRVRRVHRRLAEVGQLGVDEAHERRVDRDLGTEFPNTFHHDIQDKVALVRNHSYQEVRKIQNPLFEH
mmetsp:Transcript_2169/g.5686  ORF Transcript_2169/g.5686 Transcript_2169/m.5686 type:complete len:426 (+) Transcript_2169:1196-2473(+)